MALRNNSFGSALTVLVSIEWFLDTGLRWFTGTLYTWLWPSGTRALAQLRDYLLILFVFLMRVWHFYWWFSWHRFVVVCGDGEYIIYTAMALRNKSFGSAQEFVWSYDSSMYAIRESSSMVKISKNFKETKSFKPDFGAEGERLTTNIYISQPLGPEEI